MNRTEKGKYEAAKELDVVNSVMDAASEKVSSLIDEAKDQGERWMGKIKHQGSELVDDFQERGQGAWKDVKMWARKNPGPAMGWAFVAGAAVFALLSRSED